jgi:RHS repeat-associated protein
MFTGGASYYYHYDTLGSVRNVTSSTGATQWTDTYEPYGAIRTETKNSNQAPTNFMKFTGELSDPTGLYYLRARQYDPSLGRFVTVDPAGPNQEAAATSTYAYVDDRPTVMADPSGQTLRPIETLRWVYLAATPAMVVPGDGGGPTLIYPFAKGIPKKDVGGGVHDTGNLRGYRAIDFGAPAYTPVLAIVTGRTRWEGGGSSPTKPPVCHGAYGWNFYLKSISTGIEYFYTHLQTRTVTNGGFVVIGQHVGTLANWHQWKRCHIPDHVHIGATGPDSHIRAVFAAPQITSW